MKQLSLVALAIGCLAACGSTATTSSQEPLADGSADASNAALGALASEITKLEFSTSTSIAANPAPAVNVTVTDARLAQAAFEATLSLPAIPAGPMSCPNDFGVLYHLTFWGKNSVVAQVTLDPTGCQGADVTTTSSTTSLWAASTPTYWPALAANLEVPQENIYPYPCLHEAAVCTSSIDAGADQ
jgi:hypothetical protein